MLASGSDTVFQRTLVGASCVPLVSRPSRHAKNHYSRQFVPTSFLQTHSFPDAPKALPAVPSLQKHSQCTSVCCHPNRPVMQVCAHAGVHVPENERGLHRRRAAGHDPHGVVRRQLPAGDAGGPRGGRLAEPRRATLTQTSVCRS